MMRFGNEDHIEMMFDAKYNQHETSVCYFVSYVKSVKANKYV